MRPQCDNAFPMTGPIFDVMFVVANLAQAVTGITDHDGSCR